MRTNFPYLNDNNFLKFIYQQKIQEHYVKITLLDWKENPIKDIQGLVAGGSLNIDGQSAIRRTCNLSIIVKDEYEQSSITSIDNLFSINKKLRLYIGLKNNTQQYLDFSILWFPLGIFVTKDMSIQHSLDGISISMQLSDKMCLLNGECGGTIAATVQFDKHDTIDKNGNKVTDRPLLVQIIRELVNHFGGEDLAKIIISDVDTRLKQVMKWMGENPLYRIDRGGSSTLTTDEGAIAGNNHQTFKEGEDVGFVYTDFTFPGELIGNAGDSVCTILDKIKAVLGNYEYFYDIDGNFRFQEKKNFLNTTQAKIDITNMNQNNYLIDMNGGKAVFSFDDGILISSYSNNPQFHSIKNDFVVWGIRKNANKHDIPIRYHLAIDKKPVKRNKYLVFFYTDPEDEITKAKVPIYFENKSNFPEIGAAGNFYLDNSSQKVWIWEDSQYKMIDVQLKEISPKDWKTELYLQGAAAEPFGTHSNYYYTELLNEWPKLYDVEKGEWLQEPLNNQSGIDFYLDIIDSNAAIGQLSVSNIGRRTISIVDNNINCVFEAEVPDYVIIEAGQVDTNKKRRECEDRGQLYIQVDSSIFELLSVGGMMNSAYNKVRELLYQSTSYNETINIQSLPVYSLEPNTRVSVRDDNSDIKGDYMVNTISIPLDINGTMSVSATRALERI